MQDDLTKNNEKAWNSDTYKAWINRYGTPQKVAGKIKQDPKSKLSTIYRFFDDVNGKKIINLLGSHGIKATSLALLGANVTIVDFSEENKTYALELAKEAGVTINYLVKDVLHLEKEDLTGDFDVVFSEFGILHYFSDLQSFFQTVAQLLKRDGKFILQDFHPFSKIITSSGTTHKIRKHKVTGDYFDTSLIETDVSFSKYIETSEKSSTKVKLRKWTLGEIVTAVAREGLFIEELEELPNLSSDVFDKGIPKSFTIVARKL